MEQGNKEEEEVKKGEGRAVALAAEAAPELIPDPGPVAMDALKAFDAYNALAQRVGLPLARSLTPQRRKSLLARLREHGGYDAWTLALANIERSAFLRGGNSRGWRADLDFLLTASKFAKVVEGTYGNGAHGDVLKPNESYLDRMRRLMGRDEGPISDIEILEGP